jgi:hypothetical protein
MSKRNTSIRFMVIVLLTVVVAFSHVGTGQAQNGQPPAVAPPGQLVTGSPGAISNALAATFQSLAAQAANGNLADLTSQDLQAILNNVLTTAGIDPNGVIPATPTEPSVPVAASIVNADVANLQKLIAQQQQNQQNQNSSGSGDWFLGQIWPGVAYNTTYPLTNNCHIGQTANFSYPSSSPTAGGAYIPLTSPMPNPVGVGPNSTVPVPMVLQYPELPPPPPTAPPPLCWPKMAPITSVHMQSETAEGTGAGTYVYTCDGTQATYTIYLCLWDQAPPQQPGGGDKPKKPGPQDLPNPLGSSAQGSPCENLWNFDIFVPSEQIQSPQHCLNYIREQAHILFDQGLQPYRSADPTKWAWVPTGSAIDNLSVQQILVFKAVIYNDLAAASH